MKRLFRQTTSADVAAQALPFDWTPPTLTIPDLILAKGGYVRFICGNFSACRKLAFKIQADRSI
jgi:hypothetical protein